MFKKTVLYKCSVLLKYFGNSLVVKMYSVVLPFQTIYKVL